MMDQWEKISYIVQLIAACALFMIHSRKRANFVLRMVLCSGTLVLTSYGVNSILENQKFSVWIVLYWAAFLLVCVLLMYVCLDVSALQAAYCAICACAMQHAAFDVSKIYLEFGNSRVVQALVYAVVYALFYYLFARRINGHGESRVHLETLFPLATIIIVDFKRDGNLGSGLVSGRGRKPDFLSYSGWTVLLLRALGAGKPEGKADAKAGAGRYQHGVDAAERAICD